MPLLHMLMRYATKAITQPPHVVARKAARKVRQQLRMRAERHAVLQIPCPPVAAAFGPPLLTDIDAVIGDAAQDELVHLHRLIPFWLDHRFDLLGSGWVRWDGSGPYAGVNGHAYDVPLTDAQQQLPPAHRAACACLRAAIPVPGYVPIDWQRDVKSGFRFDDTTWHRAQPIGTRAGADIKLPWEIGRLQHLPQMAVAARTLGQQDAVLQRRLVQEYQSQVLDFLAANPVGVGGQWACAMDVGIRAVNLVLARTLFAGLEGSLTASSDVSTSLDSLGSLGSFGSLGSPTPSSLPVSPSLPSFSSFPNCPSLVDAELAQSLLRHGRFLVHHLEWSETLTSNHYLADICGLAFIAAALAPTPETDTWLAFACQQVIAECDKQFYVDGANFEASSSYHRLSLEMAVMTLALICGLPAERVQALQHIDARFLPPEPPLAANWSDQCAAAVAIGEGQKLVPSELWERLARGAHVTATLTRPDGCIAQVGDNDSGRFVRLSVAGTWLAPEAAEARYSNLSDYTARIAPYRQMDELYFDENMLDHRGVLGMAGGLFGAGVLPWSGQGFGLERRLVAALTHGKVPHLPALAPLSPTISPVSASFTSLPYSRTHILYSEASGERALTAEGYWTHLPHAGWYVYRSARVFLCVNAGGNGQNGNGGHAHNDRLSLELCVDGRDILRDPGTGLYTPAPVIRNAYRASAAHNGLYPAGEEQTRFEPDGLFWMHDDAHCAVCDHAAHMLACTIRLRQGSGLRRVEIQEHQIVVHDAASWKLHDAGVTLPLSPGYGKMMK